MFYSIASSATPSRSRPSQGVRGQLPRTYSQLMHTPNTMNLDTYTCVMPFVKASCPLYCPLLQKQRTHCTAMSHIAATQQMGSLPPSPQQALKLQDTFNYNECYHQHRGLIETKWVPMFNYISHQLDADDRSINLSASAHSPGSSMALSLCCREAYCSSEHDVIWYVWCKLMLSYMYMIVKAFLSLFANAYPNVTLL